MQCNTFYSLPDIIIFSFRFGPISNLTCIIDCCTQAESGHDDWSDWSYKSAHQLSILINVLTDK